MPQGFQAHYAGHMIS